MSVYPHDKISSAQRAMSKQDIPCPAAHPDGGARFLPSPPPPPRTSYFLITASLPLVSRSYRNKSPQTGWLKTTEKYFLMLLEAKSKVKVSAHSKGPIGRWFRLLVAAVLRAGSLAAAGGEQARRAPEMPAARAADAIAPAGAAAGTLAPVEHPDWPVREGVSGPLPHPLRLVPYRCTLEPVSFHQKACGGALRK
ncbi:MAPK regulated corepressor interacting protein 2 isoform X2 [Panthera uncia]|uniref:MAPK regulated corepressor interacting protein 2 isoform X2 n=1 Tax=Panthera uncia TaxID=29064 RepID=UPI0020FFF2DD|nr:MAPK regulated corepressor interacting protein 2 isoform X2 [Panthera uncia]